VSDGVGLGVGVFVGFGVFVGLGVLVATGVDRGVGVTIGLGFFGLCVGVGVGVEVGRTCGSGSVGVTTTGATVGDGTTVGPAAPAGLPPETKVKPMATAPVARATRTDAGTRLLRSGERGTYMTIGRSRPPLSIVRPVRPGSSERLKC
jgi:hypothetical protein